jgi:hypothetical protein
MRSALLTSLIGDSALAALLTGGIYDGATVGFISRQRTPVAFDVHTELLPCALLRIPTIIPAGPAGTSARLDVSVYLYQRSPGTAALAEAQQRLYALWHRQRISPGSGGAWELRHAMDVLDVDDDTIGASLIISRYSAWIVREPIIVS